MKKLILLTTALALLFSACAQGGTDTASTSDVLTVTGPDLEKVYTVEELRALGGSEAVFKDVTYTGVSLTTLLKDAGIDPAQAKAVKATASDGFTVNYDAALFMKEDTLVAYEQGGNPLSADDGTFRMVLPGQEGKLNVRQLVEIQVIR